MAFKKGVSGNVNGRPPGIKNRSKKTIKERIENLLEKNLDKIEQELETAAPEVRRVFFVYLAGAVLSPGENVVKSS